MNDKRQITILIGACKNGHYLSPQVIYDGKINRCLPKVKFPAGWLVTCTENHWANGVTTIDEILLPYVRKTREKMSLSPNHTCLVIFDKFKAQCTATELKALEENNILVVSVPANYTDQLQPLDIAVMPGKEFLRA